MDVVCLNLKEVYVLKIRFKYEKNDLVKYVGHLDVMSMFDRVFRRANIQVEFSQGFTKRSQIVFALPSSVGVISKCEFLEVEIPNIFYEDIPKITEKLNKHLPDGFVITQACEVKGYGSIVTKVECAEYEFRIKAGKNEIEKILKLYSNEKIFVKRTAKNGIVYDMNIKPYILDMNIETNENEVIIYTTLKSGSRENLKPDYIIQAMQNVGIDIIDYQIIKTNVILNE